MRVKTLLGKAAENGRPFTRGDGGTTMAETNDWNAKVIAQFRANGGKVGGNFEGAPITLVHHKGRKSGGEHVAPMMYLAAEDDPKTIYVFATKAGAPTNPDWYYNLTAAGNGRVEVGSEEYPVSVTELQGGERDRVFALQAGRYPGFAEYEQKTAGIRTIPVLALTRS
jgi:deazaflavin-dependent oxidoreductase (nitroreductase family)